METSLSPQEVRDITEVLLRYALGIDSRNWELLRRCFTPSLEADYGEIGRWTSADAIVAWMRETHDPLGPTLHRISNVVVSPAESGATSRSYVHAIIPANASVTVHAYGWYDDELAKTESGWRISRRRFTTVATEMHQASG
jgi:hypothetical protein